MKASSFSGVLIVWLSIVSSFHSEAQNVFSVPDSLLAYIKNGPRDTTHIRAVNEYVWWLVHPLDDPASADPLLRTAEILAKKLNDPKGLLRVYLSFSRVRMRTGQYVDAMRYAGLAQEVAKKYRPSPIDNQRLLSILGQCYFYTDKLEQGLKYYMAAIALTEKYNITDNSARAFIGASEVFSLIGRHDDAFSFAQKAVDLAYHDQDKTIIVWSEMRLSSLYEQQGKPALAIVHLNRAIPYADLYSNMTQKISIWNVLAAHYINANQYQKGQRYLGLIKKNVNANSNPGIKISGYSILGLYHVRNGRDDLAEEYLLKSFEAARKAHFLQGQVGTLKDLSLLYERTSQYKKAYQHQLLLEEVKDSLVSAQLVNKTRDLITKYESQKKEDQIRLLNQQRKNDLLLRNAILAGALLLVALLGLLVAWLINRAKVQQMRQAQGLRQQIANDLHDEVGSTLSSISLLSGVADNLLDQNRNLVRSGSDSEFIENPYDPAQKIIKKIYSDTRQILESVDEIIWTIQPSDSSFYNLVQRLRDFASPLMESKKIDYSFSTLTEPDHLELSIEVRRNIYLIAKEAVNNLVKHSGATKASITFSTSGKQVRLSISDNGKGFDTEKSFPRNGQRSMKQRALAIGAKLDIQSRPLQGTIVDLCLNMR